MSIRGLAAFEKFTSVNGARTHYYDTGEGDALVLIHGAGAGTGAAVTWLYNIPQLSKDGFRVIAIDRLGHGLTDMPKKPDYSLKASAEHVVALLKKLGIESAFVLGWSQGAWVAVYMAVKYPEMVKKLIIAGSGAVSIAYDYRVSTRPNVNPRPDAYAKRYSKENVEKWYEAYTYRQDLVTEEMKAVRLAYGKRNFGTFKRRMDATGSTAISHLLDQSINGKHVSEFLVEIGQPTLILWSTKDAPPLEKGIWLLNNIRGSQMHIFNNSKHEIMIDQYEGFNRIVNLFCEMKT